MSPRRRFRPSESWTLEDRLAPSSLAPAQIHALATQQVRGTVKGFYSTTTKFGVNTAVSSTYLVGSASVSGIGAVNMSASLVNSVVAKKDSLTTGAIVLVAANNTGTLTLAVSGAYANLAPTHSTVLKLNFVVVKATGSYVSGLHATGSITVTLQETVPAKTSGLTSITGGKATLVFTA